jgi:3-phenylpropionate/trans-cinnamate dioxygenase ferredoxin component
MMDEFTIVATKGDLAAGQSILVEIHGLKIALFNTGSGYYAISDTCSHRGGPLSQGQLDGFVITCPWHGARFDLRTGNVLTPFGKDLATYKVVIEGEHIKIET